MLSLVQNSFPHSVHDHKFDLYNDHMSKYVYLDTEAAKVVIRINQFIAFSKNLLPIQNFNHLHYYKFWDNILKVWDRFSYPWE